MKRNIIFEGIFILILTTLISYFVLSVLVGTNSISISAPVNNTNLSTKVGIGVVEYNFTCNATNITMDGVSVNNISIWGDIGNSTMTNLTYREIMKNVTYSGISNDSLAGFNISNMSDGIFKWACVVGYANGSIHRSNNYTINIDTTAPLINSTAQNTTISNGTWVSNNTGVGGVQSPWAISTRAYDLGLANCTLVVWDIEAGAWAVNVTNYTVQNGTQFVFSQVLTGGEAVPYLTFANGNKTGWRYDIYCYDNTNHTSAANITLFVDGLYPIGNITTQNSSGLTVYENWTDETVNISAFAGDIGGSGIVNCSLYGDFDGTWTRNQTKDPVLNDTNFEFHLNLSTNSTGYKYNILCKDAANNRKNASVGLYTLRVDSGMPGATIASSAGSVLGLGQSTTLSCTGTEDIAIESTSIDLCSGASSCIFPMATTTSQTATCTVTDKVGHSATSSITLTSSEGGGGGSGGSGGETTTTDISETPTTVKSTGVGGIIPLTIAGENYNLEIKSVGLVSTTLNIAGQSLSLVLGETKSVDLNSDGTDDVEITLNSLADSKPQFTIKEIPLQAGINEEVTTPEEIQEKISGLSPIKIGLIILSIAIILIIIIYLIERRK